MHSLLIYTKMMNIDNGIVGEKPITLRFYSLLSREQYITKEYNYIQSARHDYLVAVGEKRVKLKAKMEHARINFAKLCGFVEIDKFNRIWEIKKAIKELA